MSLTAVLPYFRDCICSIGYVEWEAEVTSDEPPNSTVERNFTLNLGNILVNPVNHTSFEYTVPVTVIIYTKTFRSKHEGIDCLLEKVDDVNCCLLDVRKRYQAAGGVIKSISPNNVNFEPISISNDNVLKAVMDFDVRLEVSYGENRYHHGLME